MQTSNPYAVSSAVHAKSSPPGICGALLVRLVTHNVADKLAA